MGAAQLALQIIALLEQVEPEIQSAVMSIIADWQSNADVKTTLQGEVTALNAIAAQARIEEGLPPVTPPVDPDPEG
jgi:hypothetical protein